MGLFEHIPYTDFHRLNLDWLLKKVRTLEEKVAALEQEAALIKARISSLEIRIAEAEADIELLRVRMSTAEQEINSLKSRIADLESRATQLENRMTAAEQNVTALGQRLTAAEQSITALGDRVAALESLLTPVNVSSQFTIEGGAIAEASAWKSGHVINGRVAFTPAAGEVCIISVPAARGISEFRIWTSVNDSAGIHFVLDTMVIASSYSDTVDRVFINQNLSPAGTTHVMTFTYIVKN